MYFIKNQTITHVKTKTSKLITLVTLNLCLSWMKTILQDKAVFGCLKTLKNIDWLRSQKWTEDFFLSTNVWCESLCRVTKLSICLQHVRSLGNRLGHGKIWRNNRVVVTLRGSTARVATCSRTKICHFLLVLLTALTPCTFSGFRATIFRAVSIGSKWRNGIFSDV